MPITGLATWYSLRQINRKPDPTAEIPKASLLTAAFFVASSIYIPNSAGQRPFDFEWAAGGGVGIFCLSGHFDWAFFRPW
jgi:hypothetical protein